MTKLYTQDEVSKMSEDVYLEEVRLNFLSYLTKKSASIFGKKIMVKDENLKYINGELVYEHETVSTVMLDTSAIKKILKHKKQPTKIKFQSFMSGVRHE